MVGRRVLSATGGHEFVPQQIDVSPGDARPFAEAGMKDRVAPSSSVNSTGEFAMTLMPVLAMTRSASTR